SRRRHTRFSRDWSSDVCSSDLLMLELIGREDWHLLLRQQVAQAGEKAWSDEGLRQHVRHVILELLRFRPVFPIVVRDIPRATLRSEERRVGKEWRSRSSREEER